MSKNENLIDILEVANKTGESVADLILKKLAEGTVSVPKPSPEYVEKLIAFTEYQFLPDGRSTLCTIGLINGFVTHGISSTVSIEHFDAEMGRQAALKKAMEKVWEAAALLTIDRTYRENIATQLRNRSKMKGTGLLFRHYSGAIYRLLNVAKNEKDLVENVVYQSVNDGAIFVRPTTEFYEKFTCITDINFKEHKLIKLQAEYDELVLKYSTREEILSHGKPDDMSDQEWNLIRSEFLPMREQHEILMARIELMREEFNNA